MVIKYVADRASAGLDEFFKFESASTILLLAGTALALFIVNFSPATEHAYHEFLHAPIHLEFGSFKLHMHVLHWINDGLMALFFLVVGLELKREVLEGQLSKPSQVALPVVAALGGMFVPALFFAVFNMGETLQGWAIPAATDIAFSLGILAVLISRLPTSLKIFLMALAIIDDLGAIVIIALFYTSQLDVQMLMYALIALAALVTLNISRTGKLIYYLLLGLIMWYFTLQSGVHATLAGVALAFCVPLRVDEDRDSPLHDLEHGLHPWISFGVVPIFAFANAGISFHGVSFDTLLQPVPLGIIAGLFFGKQIGVFGFSWLSVNVFKWASLPEKVTWQQMYGVALLCGIGFTMSLFIGGLAFGDDAELMNEVRLGVIVASILSAVVGFIVLYLAGTKKQEKIVSPEYIKAEQELIKLFNSVAVAENEIDSVFVATAKYDKNGHAHAKTLYASDSDKYSGVHSSDSDTANREVNSLALEKMVTSLTHLVEREKRNNPKIGILDIAVFQHGNGIVHATRLPIKGPSHRYVFLFFISATPDGLDMMKQSREKAMPKIRALLDKLLYQ